MPTGFTSEVMDGKVTDLATFALRCARNFGAAILQRDEDATAPVLLPEMSDYHAKALKEAEDRLESLQHMSDRDAGLAADAAHAKAVEEATRYSNNRRDVRARYERMLDQVRAWTPPTPDHKGLREFMESQLLESIRFDCDHSVSKPVAKTGAEWLAAERAKAAHSIGYHRAEHEAEQQRHAARCRWISELYRSLDLTVATLTETPPNAR